ncbi:hypothetical protein AHiyo4_43780 [Arthrobacter sp. Hiyo4]|nr:hypothetical protein AHiyo4_43780 [Arthrobacter sp. Hiyo4]
MRILYSASWNCYFSICKSQPYAPAGVNCRDAAWVTPQTEIGRRREVPPSSVLRFVTAEDGFAEIGREIPLRTFAGMGRGLNVRPLCQAVLMESGAVIDAGGRVAVTAAVVSVAGLVGQLAGVVACPSSLPNHTDHTADGDPLREFSEACLEGLGVLARVESATAAAKIRLLAAYAEAAAALEARPPVHMRRRRRRCPWWQKWRAYSPSANASHPPFWGRPMR